MRATLAAAALDENAPLRRLPSLARVQAAGIHRGVPTEWPEAHTPSDAFMAKWARYWPGGALPRLLLCWHPSAQNMSPFASAETVFHGRMIETRNALRSACAALDPRLAWAGHRAADHSSISSPSAGPVRDGVYALPEWTGLIAPYHDRLITLWHERGIG
jgi:hypothetical protein